MPTPNPEPRTLNPRTIVRTLDFGTVGNRFEEGPVELFADDLRCSVQVAVDGKGTATAFSTGAASVRGGVERGSVSDFSTPVTIDSSNLFRRLIGDATHGVAGERFLDGVVTALQANLVGRFTFYFNPVRD